MKKLLSLVVLIALVLSSVVCLSVSAESFIDEDKIIYDFMPDAQMEKLGILETTGCELKYNADGSVTAKLTATSAMIQMTLAKEGTVYVGGGIDLSNPAYFVIDYGTLGNARLGDTTIFKYTRKDKDALGTFAELWLVSLFSDDYKQYRKLSDVTENGKYSVWDWGTYVSSSETKLFDDKTHRFVSFEIPLEGSIGAELTFYSLCVSNTCEIDDLGAYRPEEPGESSEEPVESSEEPSEEPAESSDEPSESSDEPTEEPAESSEEPTDSTEEPVEESSEAPADETSETPVESSEASIDESSETPAESSEVPAESAGFPVWAIILIAVVVVAAVVAAVLFLSKKKK